ncbi:MAG: hypothetical protein ABWZ03_08120 [Solirubrobacterales bacterium]
MRSKLTYANVASTIALFLALTGGVVYAASKIGTKDIQRQAVTEKKIAPGAVKNGKLAAGSVSTEKLADAAVGNDQVKNDSIQPGKLSFPVFYVATPAGGSQPVTSGQDPDPLSNGQWTQRKDAVNVVFGSGTATLAYDGSGSGSCQVFFDIRVDGQQVGGGQLQTSSTTPEQVTQQIGAAPGAGPTQATERTLTVQVGSNGDCEAGSTIDSTRFQVLNFG